MVWGKDYTINTVMNKKNGFTLTELLIVMAIIAVLAIITAGIINPVNLINKGKDTQRKKDLGRIKVAFEEYFNDKGCYPTDTLLNDLEDSANCNSSSVFSPYLSPWPCNSNDQPYIIFVPNCTTFKVITNLLNKKDNDIPTNWYIRQDVATVDGYGKDQVNYGVSSSNILWYDTMPKDYSMCETDFCAYVNTDGSGGCKTYALGVGCTGGLDDSCYFRESSGSCTGECKVAPGDHCPM